MIFIFLLTSNNKHLFLYILVIGIWLLSFGEMSFQVPYLLFSQVIRCFSYWVVLIQNENNIWGISYLSIWGIPHVFWRLNPDQIHGVHIFSPIPFSVWWSFPWLGRGFWAWYNATAPFLLLLSVINVMKFSPMFSSRSFRSHI